MDHFVLKEIRQAALFFANRYDEEIRGSTGLKRGQDSCIRVSPKNRSGKLIWHQLVRRAADWLMGIAILLTITDLFKIIGVALNLGSLLFVTSTLAFLSVAYVLINFHDIPITRNRMILFGILVVALPTVSLLYSPVNASRDLALQVYYFLLFISSSIYFSRRQDSRVLLFLALAAATAGAVLSILRPELFIPLSEITESKSSYSGRAFGLYLQPNKCAENMVWILLMVFLAFRSRKNVWFWFQCGVVMLIVALTGSRGGMVAALFALLGFLSFNGPRFHAARFVNSVSSGGLTLIAAVLFLISVLSYFQEDLYLGQPGGVMERISSLYYPSALIDDGSIAERQEAQSAYLDAIASENVVWGYGLGAAAYYRGTDVLGNHAAHNQFIEYVFAYGLLGFFVLLICGRQIWLDLKRVSIALNFQIHSLFMGVLLLFFLASNTVLGSRNLYILLGFLYAQHSAKMTLLPGHVLSRSDMSGRPRLASCRKIRARN